MQAGPSQPSAIRIGDLVTFGHEGPIMRVAKVENHIAVCLWRARHHVHELACSTQALLKVAPNRLLPIWGYWGDGGEAPTRTDSR